jgi:hypothetical protein
MPKSFAGEMHAWGQNKLHSGSKTGPLVTSQKQALAIAFSEQRKKMAGRKKKKK